ncbi:Snf7 [Carpediemonas membranifera]|uniref:Snf7 n=1 Tax=Carpediemonas membranifera TaxID=201153 RepID=A0A8J6AU13_9EUKA|nr:Snf7 [Carpediemonas membranifera]QNO39416.1 vacuolar protein sorting 60A [Carpediemonas membranifera]|eukprot:KAG9394636.1 Snf7 [Carpediemonas membranifera]
MPLKKSHDKNVDDVVSSMELKAQGLRDKIQGVNDQIDRLKQQLAGPTRDTARAQATKLLQQRRQYQRQLTVIEKQSMNITAAKTSMSILETSRQTFDAMSSLNKAMGQRMKGFSADKIADLQDDMSELLYSADEITNTLSQDFAVPDSVTDADLELEMSILESEIAAGQMTEAGARPVYLEQSAPAEDEDEFII